MKKPSFVDNGVSHHFQYWIEHETTHLPAGRPGQTLRDGTGQA